MLDRIIRFSIQNKLVIGFLTLLLVIWGGWSATRLPIDAVPDITNNQVQIITVAPTLAGQEVDGFFFGNDFGTQLDLICGPTQFDQFVMPWFRRTAR